MTSELLENIIVDNVEPISFEKLKELYNLTVKYNIFFDEKVSIRELKSHVEFYERLIPAAIAYGINYEKYNYQQLYEKIEEYERLQQDAQEDLFNHHVDSKEEQRINERIKSRKSREIWWC